MSGLYIDLQPIISGGFVYAAMLLGGLGGLLALIFGFGIFRWLFAMFRDILGNLGRA